MESYTQTIQNDVQRTSRQQTKKSSKVELENSTIPPLDDDYDADIEDGEGLGVGELGPDNVEAKSLTGLVLLVSKYLAMRQSVEMGWIVK